MTLVPLVSKESAADVDLPALEAGESAYGQLLNTWRAIANREGLFAVYLPFLRGVAGPGALDQRTKELTAIYVTILNHCRYSASHRCASGKAQGLTDDDLAALAEDRLDAFSDRERLALEFTRELTLAPATVRVGDVPTAVSAELRDAVAAAFDPPALTELCMSVAIWNALTRFHRVMDFELDMPAPPPAVESAL